MLPELIDGFFDKAKDACIVETLETFPIDVGYSRCLVGNVMFYKITNDISVSAVKYHKGDKINLFFHKGTPILFNFNKNETTPQINDYFGLSYVISGDVSVKIHDKKYLFQKNDFFLAASSVPKEECLLDSEGVLLHIDIDRQFLNREIIEEEKLAPFQQYLRFGFIQQAQTEDVILFRPEKSEQKKNNHLLIASIFNEITKQEAGYRDICKGMLTRIIDDLSHNYKYTVYDEEEDKYCKRLFNAVASYMAENLNTVTLDQLVSFFHYHRNYYSSLIHQYTGCTYSQYLIRLRIEKAKEYLRSTTLPIDNIIWMVGYNNKGFFYKKFQEILGMSPNEYRKQSRYMINPNEEGTNAAGRVG